MACGAARQIGLMLAVNFTARFNLMSMMSGVYGWSLCMARSGWIQNISSRYNNSWVSSISLKSLNSQYSTLLGSAIFGPLAPMTILVFSFILVRSSLATIGSVPNSSIVLEQKMSSVLPVQTQWAAVSTNLELTKLPPQTSRSKRRKTIHGRGLLAAKPPTTLIPSSFFAFLIVGLVSSTFFSAHSVSSL